MRLRNHLLFYFLLITSKPIVPDELVTEDTFIDYLSNLSSISAKKSSQNPLPRGSSQVSGKFKIFKKLLLKTA